MNTSDVLKLVQVFGIPAVLFVLILWTGARGVWTWGRETKRERERADRYEGIAFRAVGAAEGGTEVARQLAEEHQQRTTELVEEVVKALSERGP